jgi:hypothetical protein
VYNKVESDIILKHPVGYMYLSCTIYSVLNATIFTFFFLFTTCFSLKRSSSKVLSTPKLSHCIKYIKCSLIYTVANVIFLIKFTGCTLDIYLHWLMLLTFQSNFCPKYFKISKKYIILAPPLGASSTCPNDIVLCCRLVFVCCFCS